MQEAILLVLALAAIQGIVYRWATIPKLDKRFPTWKRELLVMTLNSMEIAFILVIVEGLRLLFLGR